MQILSILMRNLVKKIRLKAKKRAEKFSALLLYEFFGLMYWQFVDEYRFYLRDYVRN